ncbi:hypothetical protein TIFTF001_027521 [Ficus carica]|uniref:Uncharacterized protein n=1 Tax=Ficus carica TaxID=3494 RepID=A0AA88DN61_FICCA|nr:hypothetical protein TIFTF001_027521 [Ficus carica]
MDKGRNHVCLCTKNALDQLWLRDYACSRARQAALLGAGVRVPVRAPEAHRRASQGRADREA